MVLLIALALLLGLFIVFLLFNPRNHKSGHKGKAVSSSNNDKTHTPDMPRTLTNQHDSGSGHWDTPNLRSTSKSYKKTEVTLHNKRTDCWIIIKNKVYDVTSYVEEHPGGDAILAHAGDDSTEGFFGPQHATRVFDMIEDFYIGDLEQ